MSISNTVKTNMRRDVSLPTLPSNFLNAYEVMNGPELSWPVNIYAVDLNNHREQDHEQRSRIKNVIWELRNRHKGRCRGYGFVVDISPRLVAVPKNWELPTPITNSDYAVKLEQSFLARASDKAHRPIVA